MTQTDLPSVPSPSLVGASVENKIGTPSSNQKQQFVMPWMVPWIVSFMFWGVGVLLFFIVLSNDVWFAWRQFVARYVLQSEHITLTNHIFDRNQYIVGHVKLNKPGYLVLYFADQYDTGMRNPVGFTNLLFPGDYTNVQIKVNDGRLEGEDPSQYGFGASLYVALFHDDGDKLLNTMEPDKPKDTLAKDAFGQPIFAKLTL